MKWEMEGGSEGGITERSVGEERWRVNWDGWLQSEYDAGTGALASNQQPHELGLDARQSLGEPSVPHFPRLLLRPKLSHSPHLPSLEPGNG